MHTLSKLFPQIVDLLHFFLSISSVLTLDNNTLKLNYTIPSLAARAASVFRAFSNISSSAGGLSFSYAWIYRSNIWGSFISMAFWICRLVARRCSSVKMGTQLIYEQMNLDCIGSESFFMCMSYVKGKKDSTIKTYVYKYNHMLFKLEAVQHCTTGWTY